MAQTNSDGSIILNTKVDTNGINKGMNSIKGSIGKIGGLMAAAFSVKVISNFTKESVNLYKIQMQNEVKLATVMRERVNATNEQIQAILDLTAAEQELGIIGDEVQIAGLQQLATFAKQTETIETLLPAMNNLIAQQYGFEASTGSAVNVANLMGKVLQGQTGALTRVGITFTEAQEEILKYGTESEKAATLAQVITDNVGEMNKALAKTDVGRQQQLANTMGDIKEQFGEAANQIAIVFLPLLQSVANVLRDIAKIARAAASNIANAFGAENNQKQWEKIAEDTDETAENIDEQTDAQKDLNKEMKKTLAGFDEIQILSSQTSETSAEAGVQGGQPLEAPPTPIETGEDVQNKVNEKLAAIIEGVGFALAALGIVLLCFGQIGWGIGLLIAGIAVFSVSRASLSNETENKTKEKLDAIVAIASGALLALGIILLFTPASLPLAIGLIIVGAAGLAAEVAFNWDAVTEKVNQIFTDFGEIIAAAGAALIVLGIILCCTGVGIGLGIGLIIAGAAAITGAVAFNWDTILDWLKGLWEAIKAFWNTYIAPVFTAKFWLDLAKKCGNGLIGGFEAAINGIISMFEKMINWIVDGINSIGFDIPDWLGGGHFGFNIPNVSFGRVSIPRLAQGAVIPPNREFLAILGDQKHGTNIEAPLQTIVDAFNIALAQNGGVNYGGGNTEVVLEIDGREFGRAVVEQGNKENRRIGTRLVIV